MARLVIEEIKDEGDRVLLYPKDTAMVIRDVGIGTIKTQSRTMTNFHVIASKVQSAGLKKGDTVEYEPSGVNFGFFLRKV